MICVGQFDTKIIQTQFSAFEHPLFPSEWISELLDPFDALEGHPPEKTTVASCVDLPAVHAALRRHAKQSFGEYQALARWIPRASRWYPPARFQAIGIPWATNCSKTTRSLSDNSALSRTPPRGSSRWASAPA